LKKNLIVMTKFQTLLYSRILANYNNSRNEMLREIAMWNETITCCVVRWTSIRDAASSYRSS